MQIQVASSGMLTKLSFVNKTPSPLHLTSYSRPSFFFPNRLIVNTFQKQYFHRLNPLFLGGYLNAITLLFMCF